MINAQVDDGDDGGDDGDEDGDDGEHEEVTLHSLTVVWSSTLNRKLFKRFKTVPKTNNNFSASIFIVSLMHPSESESARQKTS